MIAIISKTIRTHGRSLLINCMLSALFVGMYVMFFPMIKDQAQELTQIFEAYPADFLSALGVDAQQIFLSLESFLSAEYYSLLWPILLIVLLLGIGGSTVAGEIEQGTIELLLSLPVSRAMQYVSKLIGGIILLLAFIIFSNGIPILFAEINGIEYNTQSFLSAGLLGLLFGLTILSMTVMFSSIFSSKGTATSASAIILILMYAAKIFANLQTDVEFLKYFSFFHYFDFNSALISQEISLLSMWAFIWSSVIFLLIGLWAFMSRDIAAT